VWLGRFKHCCSLGPSIRCICDNLLWAEQQVQLPECLTFLLETSDEDHSFEINEQLVIREQPYVLKGVLYFAHGVESLDGLGFAHDDGNKNAGHIVPLKAPFSFPKNQIKRIFYSKI